MTFNEWFSKQKLIVGNIVEIAYDIAQKAWNEARKFERKEILARSTCDGGKNVMNRIRRKLKYDDI